MNDTAAHKKESQPELSMRLAEAAKHVVVGARYMHYKQLSYKVLALALREEDNEPCVVYQAEYGNDVIWVRPVTSWLEQVEVNGQLVQRFAAIQ